MIPINPMKPIKKISAIVAIVSLLLCCMNTSALAADVDARLSTREAWVGMPVVLQLSISNAGDYEQPTMPEIDGCDIRSAGAPSQSTQTTIINGRRNDTRSVVMQYLITPRREGTYEIPPITVKVDGHSVTTQKLRFVATKSQTGNLLFVEIEGGKNKVFVGQPLELKLKIWIKPFQDPERNLTLSEENMWQMISEQTSWGSLLDRMKELAANNQRPGGKEILRDDGQGNERSYYLYEITATVYPKRPGKIDADDVQIVVNYPTELGKARDPFGDFFGGRSPLSQMMDDDFFSSPFSNRLTVSASRPIVAEAKVDATEVLPVPSAGRPADYRGAVGRYNIVTQATPTMVNAGDPITLNIGIAGTGPMELVQAPPLFELPSLTVDFKVADQSLAGFVQDNTKLFSTTIRPRREGITQIPSIPFSFFDPDTGKYETVMSEPIAITVDKSESLSLDAIVGKQRHDDGPAAESGLASKTMEPDFTNENSASVLVSQSPAAASGWWLWFVIVPPMVWMITVIVRHRAGITGLLSSFRSAKTRFLRAIDSAERSSEIVAALTRYVASRTKQSCSSPAVAVGVLRTAGNAQVANDVEAFFQRSEESQFSGSSQQSLSKSREEANALLSRIEAALNSVSKSQVRRTGQAAKNLAARAISSTAQRASMLILAALVATSASAVTAAETSTAQSGAATVANVRQQAPDTITLSPVQQQMLLAEAGDLYSRAIDVAKTDAAEANDLFTSSAAKYQLLVDSGIHNARLYRNFGNACLQCNQLGRAIVNYERARQFDSGDRQLEVNLEFANSLVKGQDSKPNSSTQVTSGDATSLESILQKLGTMNALLINMTGMSVIIWTAVISSLLFWSFLTARALGYRFPMWRFAIVPLLLLTTSLTSLILASTQAQDPANGIIVSDTLNLYAGDGDLFDVVLLVEAAQGHRVQILETRGDWTRVRTRRGQTGWLPARSVESFLI